MKTIKFLLLTIVILLTGCSYKELNELAIGSALGIDYIDNEYLITVQVLNLKKSGENSEQENSIIYKANGKTIAEAIRNISLTYPKTIYFGHLELVILGSTTLNKNIGDLFDYFIRSPETRDDFDVIVNPSGSANEILEQTEQKTNSFPSKEIISTIENSMSKQGSTVKINMEELISNYLQKGIDPVLTSIEKVEGKNKLTGIIAFDDNRTNNIIALSTKSAMAYNLINENFYDILITTPYKDTTVDLLVLTPKTNIDMTIKENKINIVISIKASLHVSEIKTTVNLEDSHIQKEIQDSINKTLSKYVNDLLDTCKKSNIDILGLKNMIYKKHYKDYKRFSNKNIYEIANIKVNITTDLYRYGNLYRSSKGE